MKAQAAIQITQEVECESLSESEAICRYLESIKEFRFPEIFRGCFGEVDAEGYQPITGLQEGILRGVAKAIRRGDHLKPKRQNTMDLDSIVKETIVKARNKA